ncbi:MAG: hypothetical protein ACLUNO_05610 [Oscillospiraceae bacterium]
MQSSRGLSLVECRLLTGRTHQIRAQMAAAGCPLLGDGKYGRERINRTYGETGQMLYSYKLTFTLPTDAGIPRISARSDISGAAGRLRGEVFPGLSNSINARRRTGSPSGAVQLVQKPRRVSPPERRKKVRSFSSATCAAKKILLGLQTCAPSALGGRRVRCSQAANSFVKKYYFLTVFHGAGRDLRPAPYVFASLRAAPCGRLHRRPGG